MAEKIKATNHYVHVKRHETETEKGGLIIPTSGRVKPHSGVILSAGPNVKDYQIKNGKGKIALWHSTVGQEMSYDGQDFLILEDIHILGIV